MSMKPAISILSYGLNPYRDMTIETYQLLREASQVYAVMTHPQLPAFLEEHHIRYTDISYLYEQGLKRALIYEHIALYILEQAHAQAPICYLTYGHPLLFDRPCKHIVEEAGKQALSVYLAPAISFLDAMLSYLRISITTSGLCIYEATHLVEEQFQINTKVPCFIAQVGSFGNTFAASLQPSEPGRLYPLISYLRNFYPADHLVTLCEANTDGLDLLSCSVPLCALPLLAPGITNSGTLYLSPINS